MRLYRLNLGIASDVVKVEGAESVHPRSPDLRNDTGKAIFPISGQQKINRWRHERSSSVLAADRDLRQAFGRQDRDGRLALHRCAFFYCAPRPRTSRTRRREHDYASTCLSAVRLPRQEL